MVIYKYELAITDYQEIPMKYHYAPLAVGEQNGKLMMWVEQSGLEFEDGSQMLRVRIIGTGNPYHERDQWMHHVGTVIMSYGAVWHVFAG